MTFSGRSCIPSRGAIGVTGVKFPITQHSAQEAFATWEWSTLPQPARLPEAFSRPTSTCGQPGSAIDLRFLLPPGIPPASQRRRCGAAVAPGFLRWCIPKFVMFDTLGGADQCEVGGRIF